MNIFFDHDLDTRKFEGRTFLTLQLGEHIKKEGFKIVKDIAQADIIHTHTSSVFHSYKTYKLKKKYKKPCIYTLYTIGETEIVNHFKNFIQQRYYFEKTATNSFLSYSAILPYKWRGYFLKKLDVVTTPSIYVKEKLFKNTKVVKFGIDTDYFKPLEYKFNTKIKVAFIGHPGIFKGLLDFITASTNFQQELIETHIFVTNLTEKIKKTIIHKNESIQIHGLSEDIVKNYNEMDIIVLPYRNPLGAIANPLVLLEAMSCGKAIITTNLPFITEITKNAAIIINPYSPLEIAKEVNELANNHSKRIELGQIARKRIVTEYNQKTMFKEFIQIYQSFNINNQENKTNIN